MINVMSLSIIQRFYIMAVKKDCGFIKKDGKFYVSKLLYYIELQIITL
jgi:hypothetical protein